MKETIKLHPYKDDPLTDLIFAMAMREEDEKNASEAFTEFYKRFKNYVYTIAYRACQHWKQYGEEELTNALLNNTFLTFYLKSGNFYDKIDQLPLERQEARVKALLGRISQRELLALTKEKRDDNIDFVDVLEDQEVDNSTYEESADFQLMEKALDSISEKKRDILVTYTLYGGCGKKLPDEDIERLANTWEVHPDSLRQIKKRALDEIKEIFIRLKNDQNGKR
jgi:RNA polymerase sigma factor (sigma-70 family)